jgi:transcriptional regulator with XRE-family HTH domain
MSKKANKTSSILDDILNETTEKEVGLIEYRMLLAEKIDKALKVKGWRKKDLAEAIGKSRSTVTQWLSGTHNFTSDTLWEIGEVLGVKLLNIQEPERAEQKVVYQINLSSEAEPEKAYIPNSWLNYPTGYKDIYVSNKPKNHLQPN